MKKLLMCGLAFASIGLTSMTFAKSRAKSSKSSSKTSSAKSDAPAKKNSDTTKGKQSSNRKPAKQHRCKLPDGKIDTSMSQEDCIKANGKWVKY